MARGAAGMTFKMNHAEFERWKRSPEVERYMERVADKLARDAERNGGRFTQRYGSDYKAEGNGDGTATAYTEGPMAHWDEWGNATRSPRSPMRRALSQNGLLSRTRLRGK